MDLLIRSNKGTAPHIAASQGLTLIELMVVAGVMVLVIGGVLPSIRLFLVQTGQQDALLTYVQALHRAQTLAQAGKGDSAWGVRAATSSIVLFKGSTYASRDTTYDEPYTSQTPFTVSGLTEVVFSKFVGTTTTTGTTTIAAYGAQSKTVYINGKGILTY